MSQNSFKESGVTCVIIVKIILFLCRFLATGDLFSAMASRFRVGKSTAVGTIIVEVFEAIWIRLKNFMLCHPTPNDLIKVAGVQETMKL